MVGRTKGGVAGLPRGAPAHDLGSIGRAATAWLWASVILAVATAASAYPARGIWMATDGPMLFTALTLIALSMAALTSRRPLALPNWRVAALLGAGLALIGASAALSEFWPFALFGSPRIRLGVISLVPLIAIAVLAASFVLEIRAVLSRVAPWVIAAWVIAVAGQVIGGLPEAWGLSSNAALSAQLLVLMLPLALTAIANPRLSLLAGAGVAGVLFFIDSLLGVVFALGWTLAHTFVSRERMGRALWPAAPFLPAAHAATAAVGVTAVLATGLASEHLATRPWFWRSALEVIEQWWPIGAGPDAFPHVAAQLISPASAYIESGIPALSVSAHNIWLDIGVHGGVALAALVLVGATALASAWVRARQVEAIPYIAGVGFFAATLLLQPLSLQSLPVLILMAVATLPAPVSPPRAPHRTGRSRVAEKALAAAGVVCAVPLLLFALTCLAVGRPDHHPASAAFTESMARAWRWDPELWAQSAYRHGLELERQPGREGRLRYIEAGLSQAVELVPAYYRYLLELAHVSDSIGMPPAIVSARYDAALEAFPLSPEVNFSRGLFRASQGDVAAARASYRVLADLYPDWSGTRAFVLQAEAYGISLYP